MDSGISSALTVKKQLIIKAIKYIQLKQLIFVYYLGNSTFLLFYRTFIRQWILKQKFWEYSYIDPEIIILIVANSLKLSFIEKLIIIFYTCIVK